MKAVKKGSKKVAAKVAPKKVAKKSTGAKKIEQPTKWVMEEIQKKPRTIEQLKKLMVDKRNYTPAAVSVAIGIIKRARHLKVTEAGMVSYTAKPNY